jgi:hypothetical protein
VHFAVDEHNIFLEFRRERERETTIEEDLFGVNHGIRVIIKWEVGT